MVMIYDRVPVQSNKFEQGPQTKRGRGTITWAEHKKAWKVYAKRFGVYQSIQRIAERGGFGYNELCKFLGYPPATWEIL